MGRRTAAQSHDMLRRQMENLRPECGAVRGPHEVGVGLAQHGRQGGPPEAYTDRRHGYHSVSHRAAVLNVFFIHLLSY